MENDLKLKRAAEIVRRELIEPLEVKLDKLIRGMMLDDEDWNKKFKEELIVRDVKCKNCRFWDNETVDRTTEKKRCMVLCDIIIVDHPIMTPESFGCSEFKFRN